jgi:hypothetical protein
MVLTTLFAALTLFQQPTSTTVIQAPAPPAAPYFVRTQDKRISLNFNNASLKDVANFLRKQKIDFAIDPDQFRDRRLTVSLSDVSSNTALSAIASALDAHWERVGNVNVLKKGTGFGQGFSSDFRWAPQGSFNMPPMPKMPDMKFYQGQGMDKKSMEEIQKAMEEAQKAFKNQQFQFKEFKGLDKAQQEEIRKALEGAQKEMERSRIQLRSLDGGKVYGLDQKTLDQLRSNGKILDGTRIYGLDKKGLDELRTRKRIVMADRSHIDELLKSITAEQKELQKKQGYLKVSDLTPEQRNMMGIKGDGTIEITIVRDGETLKIKSN